MDMAERYKRFAYVLLKEPLEVFKAGRAAYPEETEYAQAMSVQIAFVWKDSVEVEIAKKALIEELGHEHFLPGKYELCQQIHTIALAGRTTDDKIKGLKLYAEVMGLIEKPAPAQTQVNVQQTVNKVMVVPVSRSVEEWETSAVEHQQRIVQHAD